MRGNYSRYGKIGRKGEELACSGGGRRGVITQAVLVNNLIASSSPKVCSPEMLQMNASLFTFSGPFLFALSSLHPRPIR